MIEVSQQILFWALLGYLSGSIPFGLILTKMAGLGDIRQIGSGNIGSTNVLRTGNKALAATTLVLDASKAGIVVIVAQLFTDPQTSYFAGAAAFIGHVYPVWLKFNGGKGVATYIGFLLAAQAMAGLVFAAIWLGMILLFRISSLSALCACTVTPAYIWWSGNLPLAGIAGTLSLLAFWAHRANIMRLVKGNEPKIGQNK